MGDAWERYLQEKCDGGSEGEKKGNHSAVLLSYLKTINIYFV